MASPVSFLKKLDTMQSWQRSRPGLTRKQLSREGKTMVEDEFHRNESGEDNSLRLNEIRIMAAFLRPGISGCEVEKIAAGKTRRG